MHVIRNNEMGTLTLCPTEPTEREVVEFIANTVKVGEKLNYNGRQTEDDGSCTIHLRIGEKESSRRLTVRGTSADDKKSVGAIRDMCFFGSGGLVYLGKVEVEGTPALVFTGLYCKVCGGAMIGTLTCEWATCNMCAEKCKHNYIRGAVHGGDAGDLGMGYFCDICGRGKPKEAGERNKSQAEHHLSAELELGLTVIYKNTMLSPQQIAYLERKAMGAK